MASLIANGDFESVTGGQFDSWIYGPYSPGNQVATSSVIPIEGTDSANMLCGTGAGGYLQQLVSTTGLTDFAWELDFAVLPFGGTDTRALHIVTYYDVPIPSSPNSNNVDSVRVTVGGKLQYYQRYPVKGWVTTGLVANITPDTGTLGDFDGETPVVNHLSFVGSGYGTAGQSLTITLNGDTYSGAGVLNNYEVKYFGFMGTYSACDYLIDNVSFIPEPSTFMLLAGGILGFLACAWRKRR